MGVSVLYFFQCFDTVGYRISLQYTEKNSASVAFFAETDAHHVNGHLPGEPWSIGCPLILIGTGFYRPDALPVTQPTVSKQQRNLCRKSSAGLIFS